MTEQVSAKRMSFSKKIKQGGGEDVSFPFLMRILDFRFPGSKFLRVRVQHRGRRFMGEACIFSEGPSCAPPLGAYKPAPWVLLSHPSVVEFQVPGQRGWVSGPQNGAFLPLQVEDQEKTLKKRLKHGILVPGTSI